MDLSAAELQRVNNRLARILKTNQGLTTWSLQYRLCETGQVRMDPRILMRGISELADNRRPRRGQVSPGPWQPRDGILISADLDAAEASADAERIESQCSRLTQSYLPVLVDDWLEGICRNLRGTRSSLGDASQHSIEIGGGQSIVSVESVARVRTKKGETVAIWFTSDLKWIYPDDTRLWKFLLASAQENARPLLLGRKIAPVTFLMIKELGAFGLQYYSVLTGDEKQSELKNVAKDMRWINVKAISELEEHSVREKMTSAIAKLLETPRTEQQEAALNAGVQEGLCEESNAEKLLTWGKDKAVQMPPIWLASVERWISFSEYRRPGYTHAEKLIVSEPFGDASAVRKLATESTADENETAGTLTNSSAPNSDKGTVVRRIPLRLRW